MTLMRFNGICLVTRDVRRLRDFYTAVLRVTAEGDDTFTALATEGAVLSIFTEQGMERMAPGSMKGAGCGSYTLEFEVADVDEEHERLKAMNASFVKPPTTQPWGRRSVWFRDPDGNIVNFYTDMATGGTATDRPVQ
jgi:catechol 2,3-dioxygenase-like lactoylglutathione lyase family enzyme